LFGLRLVLRLLPVLLRFQLFNGFQLETVLKHHRDFVAGTNRDDRVILLSAFDVVLA
jgi:hypothetical protein